MFSCRRVPCPALLVGALSLVGCGAGDPASGTIAPTTPVSSQVQSVVVTPNPSLLRIGDTLTFNASTRDAGGSPLLGRRVTWESEFPAILSVSAAGQVTALVPGSARITASSEGASGTATVTAVR